MRLQIASLRDEVAAPKVRLDANSSNSSRPTSKRRRGGQPGHKRAIRPMVPPERLARVVDCVPTACPCGGVLAAPDPTRILAPIRAVFI